MLAPGDVITYWQMCAEEGFGLQRGMYYKPRGKTSVLLMSIRRGAPYADRVEDGGRVLIYEGHDVPRRGGITDPKSLDQPLEIDGKPTQNSLFFQAAKHHSENGQPKELVKVYEKIRQKIWVYDGIFDLVDAWVELSGARKVFKFKLLLLENQSPDENGLHSLEESPRMIPSSVKVEVWKRDRARCVKCGKTDNLHFDHIIPYSKGGSSLVAENIQILCARHNLEKLAKIE